MSEVSEFDLQGYSAAISGLVEKTGAYVAAIKSAPYRVTSGVIFREDLIAVNNHLLKREGKIPVHLPAAKQRRQHCGPRPGGGFSHSACAGSTMARLHKQKKTKPCGQALWRWWWDARWTRAYRPVSGILGAVGGPRRSWRGGELERFLRSGRESLPFASGRRSGFGDGAICGHGDRARFSPLRAGGPHGYLEQHRATNC